MLICKSGNLLSTWGETSDESSVPDRKVFALCLFGVSAFGSRHFFVYGMRSMWNRTGSRDMNLEHTFWFLVWQVVTAFGLLRWEAKCTSPKSLKKRYLVTQRIRLHYKPTPIFNPAASTSVSVMFRFFNFFSFGITCSFPMGEWERFGHSGGRCFFVLSLCDMDGEICKGCNPYDSLDNLDESIRKTRIWRIDLFL